MKKFLFIMLLTTDLFAVNSNDVFKLSQSKSPTQQKIEELYTAFDKCLKDEQTHYEIACKEYERNPYSEEYSQENDKFRQLGAEIFSYFHNELRAVSRDPQPEEEEAIRKVKKAFGLDKNTKIRIIDAKSYINGLYLSRIDKDQLIKALTSDKELEKQVDKFCENHRFVDMSSQLLDNLNAEKVEIPDNLKDNPKLKKIIRSYMIQESKKNQVYREAIVSYIAKEQAFDFVSEHFLYPKKKKSQLIVQDEEGHYFYFNSTLSYKDPNCRYYGRSFFKDANSIDVSSTGFNRGLYLFRLGAKQSFFHEIGHSLDFFSFLASTQGADNTNSIMPKILPIEVKLKVFDDNRDRLRQMIIATPEAIKGIQSLCKTEEKDPDKLLDIFRSRLEDPVFMSGRVMGDTGEIWQILGIFLAKYNGNNTLYINKISDFSLRSDIGEPIRCDHVGFYDEDINQKPGLLYRLIELKLPYDVYSALMEINGTTMDAYLQKIHEKK